MSGPTAMSRTATTSKRKGADDTTAVRRLDPARDGKPSIRAEHACFKLRLGPSKIHRWGVYADEFIPRGKKVIEYTGEKISRVETKRRAGGRLNYLFTLNSYWCIDGAVGGSGAEFINHCCDPNIYAKVVNGHILYIARRDIQRGEELTVDYHFDKDVERVECACGARMCRGTINVTD